MPGLFQDNKTGLAFIVLLITAFSIYYRSVDGPYVFDDYPNLLYNESLILEHLVWPDIKEAALSSPSSKFYRPISMLTFAANYSLAGNKNSYSVKLTNIILHLLTGAGIFILTLIIYPSLANTDKKNNSDQSANIVALCVTSLWLLHPLYVSTVLYSVQRMSMLSSLVVIYSCIGYFYFRKKTIKENNGFAVIAIGTVLMTMVAFGCKENGILLPLFLLILEFFIFRFEFNNRTSPIEKAALLSVLFVPVLVVLAVLGFYFFNITEETVLHYGFNQWERVLTEARILWMYVGWLLFINPEPMSLFNDSFEISKNLLTPVSTLISVTAWFLLLIAGWLIYRKYQQKLLLFSILWFLCGHLIESTVIPLLLVFEHRNYLAGFGVVILLVHYLYLLIQKINTHQVIKLTLAMYIFFILPATGLYFRVSQWNSYQSLTASILRARPNSTWAWVMVANYLSDQDDYDNAVLAIKNLQQIDPDVTHIFSEAILHCTHNSDRRMDDELMDKLKGIHYENMHTISALSSFKLMADTCNGSRINFKRLLTLYETIPKSGNRKFEIYRNYAISNILEANAKEKIIEIE